jgi:quercetin dioxygenase-like cupin family protein
MKPRGTLMPRKIVWDEIPWEVVNEDVSRKVIMGDHMMMVLYRFRAGLRWPEERHVSEQGGYILKGRVEFHWDDTTVKLGPGDSYFIASNVPHHSHFIEETILIDVFSPPRKKLMEKGGGFAPERTS